MGELLEDMEHAAHADHHDGGAGGGIGKYVGITMAMLGVLMAICSALVGMSRTQLIATMVDKSETANLAQTVAAKYRLMQSQLQSTHAFLQTDPAGTKRRMIEIDEVEKSAAGSPSAPAIRAMRLQSDVLMDAVIPSTADVVAMAKTTRRYMAEREAAEHWAESFGEKVEAWEKTGEHYEWAQLVSEIGIVIASIALLLRSRAAWMLSIALGLSSIGLVIFTYLTSHSQIHHADEDIVRAHAEYEKSANDKVDDANDEKLIEDTLRLANPAGSAAAPTGEGSAAAPHPATSSAAAGSAAAPHPAAGSEAPHTTTGSAAAAPTGSAAAHATTGSAAAPTGEGPHAAGSAAAPAK